MMLIGFKTGIFVLPEDGTLVSKHVGDMSVTFVYIINTMDFVCEIN